MKTPPLILPPGLTYHCGSCKLVIPADAPKPNDADCAFVAQHRLAHFNPDESLSGQHVMAAAAWTLINHKALSAEIADPESVAYKQRIHRDRKNHFAESAVRQAMTDEQVKTASGHKTQTCTRPRCPDCRDSWLFE